jgi:riboflavin synthase alpha subunit
VNSPKEPVATETTHGKANQSVLCGPWEAERAWHRTNKIKRNLNFEQDQMSQHESNLLEHSKTRSQKSHDAKKKELENQVKDENTTAWEEKNQRKIRLGLDAKQKYTKKVSDLRKAQKKNG